MKLQEKSAMRGLPEGEMKAQLTECEEKLFRLRFAHSVSPLKNGLQLRYLRRHRARLITWLRQKERNQGTAPGAAVSRA